MTDPRILSVISFIFALMTTFSLYTGIRQLRDARRAGHRIRWYKHLSLLTGLEYGLLTFVFLLRTATAQNAIAPGMEFLVGPLYLLLLIPAALVAVIVIRRVLKNMRAGGPTDSAASAPAAPALAQPSADQEERVYTKQEKEEQAQHQRQRRKKAAAARRRQAGKA